jgi:uroporphyrinogen-III synthase
MRVLVTRPERPTARTAERLRALGHEPILDPLLDLHFDPPESLDRGEAFDGVIFTSSNAVRAVAGHRDLPVILGLPVWTVGSRTTKAAAELGFAAPQAEALDLAGLAAVLRELPTGRSLLHLAGRDRAGDLAAMVGADGPGITTCVVYAADKAGCLRPETERSLRRGEVDAVLHYSRRTAEAYVALSEAVLPPAQEHPVHLCLSSAVAEPLAVRGARVRVATLPTEEALLELLGDKTPPRQATDRALDNRRASTARKSMADPENPGPKTVDEPRRSMKPRQPVIDANAKEVEPAPHEPLEVVTPGIDTPPSATDPITVDETSGSVGPTAPPEAIPVDDPDKAPAQASEPLADTPDAVTSPAPSSASDAEPRTSLGSLIGAGLAGAVISLGALLLLISAEMIPLGTTDNPALANRVAALEEQVATISRQPAEAGAAAPTPVPDNSARVDELAAQLGSLNTEVQSLRDAAASAPAQPVPTPADTASAEQVSALQVRMDELTARIESLSSAPPPAEADAVAQLSTRLDEIAARVDAPRQADPSAVQALQQIGAVNEVAGRAQAQAQQALEQTGEARQASEKAAADSASALEQANRAASLASLASLESAIMRGTPYAGALANAQGNLPQPVVATLQGSAEGGLPTLDILAARLNDAMNAAPAPAVQAEGLVDRMVEGARSLVRVRPAPGSSQEVQGTDAWAVRNRVQANLERRSYADALREWDTLDDAAKTATREQADALRQRLAVDQALDAIRADLVQDTGAAQ